MSVVSVAALKGYFETGDRPTQSQFVDVFDSLVHVSGADANGFLARTSAPNQFSARSITASGVNIDLTVSAGDGATANPEVRASIAAVNRILLVSTSIQSTVANINVTAGMSAAFSMFEIVGSLVPETDDVYLALQMGGDGNSADAGANYLYGGTGTLTSATGFTACSAGDTRIQITGNPGTNKAVGNAAEEGARFHIQVFDPTNGAARRCHVIYHTTWEAADDDHGFLTGSGHRSAAGAVNNIRLFFESGSVAAAGWYQLWGYRR
jgi:hypothetical protein